MEEKSSQAYRVEYILGSESSFLTRLFISLQEKKAAGVAGIIKVITLLQGHLGIGKLRPLSLLFFFPSTFLQFQQSNPAQSNPPPRRENFTP